MNNKIKTTRKKFLKWSGLAFVGGLLLTGKRSSVSETSDQGTVNRGHARSLAATSRIRPARHSVVRDSV